LHIVEQREIVVLDLAQLEKVPKKKKKKKRIWFSTGSHPPSPGAEQQQGNGGGLIPPYLVATGQALTWRSMTMSPKVVSNKTLIVEKIKKEKRENENFKT